MDHVHCGWCGNMEVVVNIWAYWLWYASSKYLAERATSVVPNSASFEYEHHTLNNFVISEVQIGSHSLQQTKYDTHYYKKATLMLNFPSQEQL